MTISQEELGRRIAAARQDAEMSQAELAKQLGIERSALSRVEAGKRGVDSLELFRIAEVLGKSFGYFVESPTQLSVHFRAAAETRPEAKPILAQIEQLIQDYLFLRDLGLDDQVATRPSVTAVPTEGRSDDILAQAAEAAKRIRYELGLSAGSAMDVFHVLDDMANVLFARLPLDGTDIDGCYARADGVAVIVVNTNKPGGRQRFTAAHELAHHVFDGQHEALVIDEIEFTNQRRSEKRASAFATNLLAPDEGIRQFLGAKHKLDEREIVHLQWHYGLSFEATLWRLVDAGYLTRAERQKLAEEKAPSTLAFRHGYWTHWQAEQRLLGQEFRPTRFEQMAISAYEAGKISFTRLAEMLSEKDLDKFERELTGAGIQAPELSVEDIRREARAD